LSGVEVEVNDTSQERSLVPAIISSSRPGRPNSRLSMANHDSTLMLPAFHGMGKDDV
jgi:hypothetical protein